MATTNTNSVFSMSSDSHLFLWNVLSADLTQNTWRAAINNEEMVASAHMNKNANLGKTTVHYVLSSIHTGEISFIIFF
jgi:hypothetical protein